MDCAGEPASSSAAPPASSASFTPRLDVIFENAEMLVVNKPSDVPMDGDVAAYGNTVESLVHQHMRERGIFDDAHEQLQQAGKRKKQLKFVHQLDYSTSGVLCLAFTKDMAARLAHCFEMRTTRKYYLALLHGHVPHPTPVDAGAEGEGASPTSSSSSPSFTGWVSQCDAAWRHLGRVEVETNTSDFCALLPRPSSSPADPNAAPTTPATAHTHATREGAGAEAAVHAYHASAARAGRAFPGDVSGSHAAVNRIEDLVYATLRGNAVTSGAPSAAAASVRIDLPVGYDASDPAHFRMAVTAEQSRPARTSLLVLQRTFLGRPTQSSPSSAEGRPVTRLPVTLVLLAPHTGRRHQLRVHCRAVGFPIVGDTAYCAELEWCPRTAASEATWSVHGVPRMYLHAWRLRLPGTVTRPVSEAERVSLKKKRRRETLGLMEQSGASVSDSCGEWTEFVAAPNFPDVDVNQP